MKSELELREFVIWLVSLIVALGVLHVLGRPIVPWSLWAVAVGGWSFLGWRTKRPWVAAGVVSVALIAMGRVFADVSWEIAAVAPLWAGCVVAGRRLSRLPWARTETAIAAALRVIDEQTRRVAAHQPDWLRRPAVRETGRLLVAAAVGALVFFPYLHDGIMGAGDAVWYTSMTADHLLQWRQNPGPVFVGQTEFAALGNVMPLRAAPLFQHLSLALDFLTFRAIEPYTLQNLAVFMTGVAAALSGYLCLAGLAPGHRGIALVLAALYLACPGVVALAYTGDMFMSVATLPFLPIVFAGTIHSFRHRGAAGPIMVAIGCAGCWLGHAPIGFWTTVVAAVAQLVRFRSEHAKLRWLALNAFAAALFAILCGYVFVSVSYLNGEGGYSPPIQILLDCVRRAFPGALLPVSHEAARISDYQLGYSLWMVLAAGAALAWRSRHIPALTLTVLVAGLLTLALPVPVLTDVLWRLMPRAVVDITNACPMQRLYPLIAAASVTIFVAVVTAPAARANRRVTRLIAAALGIGLLWSGLELRPFFRRAEFLAVPKSRSDDLLRIENLPATRYALMMLSEKSRYFSHGVMDYEMEQRLLTPDGQAYLQTNVGSVAPSHDHAPRAGARALPEILRGEVVPGDNRVLPLRPKLTLQPGQRYLLAMEFFDRPYEGVLQLSGPGFFREYLLPWSGKELAFGADRFHSRVIPLHTSSASPLELTLTFVNSHPSANLSEYAAFARWELIPYDREKLPIQLESMFPYRAKVQSPQPALLETFRHFTPGWTARVNGQPAELQVSDNDLVAVPVPAGESSVELVFVPPRPLLLAYWLTAAGWGGVLIWSVRVWWRRRVAN